MLRKHQLLITVIAVVLTLGLLLSGCGNSGTTQQSEMKMSWNPGPEPSTLDPQMSNGTSEAIMELNLFEGLMRLDKNNIPQNAIAENIFVSQDGLVYTIKMKDTRWSNGDPVTADDFKAAWLHALDPEAAAEYAYQLYYIKNGEAYNNKTAQAEDVGIRVVDSRTLEVSLESPTPYFKSLLTLPVYFPVNKKVAESNNGWNLNAETFISNGPYEMQSWSHNDKMVLVRNPNYWDAQAVKITELTFYLVEDGKAALTAFEAGQLDGTNNNILGSDIERLRQAGLLKSGPYLGNYYYVFNVNKKPLDDSRVRQALTMAIDRKSLIDNVLKGGQTPAFAIVPDGIPDYESGKTFRQVGGDYFQEDVAKARQLLSDAGYPEGKNFPVLSILYNTSVSHQLLAQAIQDMWSKNLGIKVNLVSQEWQVFLDTVQNGQFDIARSGWTGDYVDPMTFLDIFTAESGNNQPSWSNAEYDAALAKAKETGNQKIRMQAMHDAEKILMTEMPVMPIYFDVNNYLIKDNIKNVNFTPVGLIDFKNAAVGK
ncbi:MAG TPA: peptide ABC transporter substrate-binding protein [Desulfitobacteriaceae bacterium]|nr:peptide ABC transporter substrate-binding protein [Desulfitobacteriaceae bacterium]